MPSAADSLWQFSTRFYATPTIAEQLLRLQNDYHLNVNYLLLLLWHALSGRGAISAEQFNHWRHLTQDLEQSITMLRMVRQSVKAQLGTHSTPELQSYYLALREAELKGEQALQVQLASWAEPITPMEEAEAVGTINTNFAHYLHALDREPDEPLRATWQSVSAAALQFVRETGIH